MGNGALRIKEGGRRGLEREPPPPGQAVDCYQEQEARIPQGWGGGSRQSLPPLVRQCLQVSTRSPGSQPCWPRVRPLTLPRQRQFEELGAELLGGELGDWGPGGGRRSWGWGCG